MIQLRASCRGTAVTYETQRLGRKDCDEMHCILFYLILLSEATFNYLMNTKRAQKR